MDFEGLQYGYGKNEFIFVSYCHRNNKEANEIIKLLKGNGYRVWYDDNIEGGTNWDKSIAKHIIECGCFVALVSKEYLESGNCMDELNFARDEDKERLVINLDGVELPDEVRMRFNRMHAIYRNKYNEVDFLNKILTTQILLKYKTQTETEDNVLTVNEKSTQIKNKDVDLKPNKKKRKSKIAGISLLSVVMIAFVGFAWWFTDTLNKGDEAFVYLEQYFDADGNMINDGLVSEQNGVVYYQNHNDNWYLYKEENGVHKRMNTDNSWCICSDMEYVYYANVDDGSSIYRIKINGEGREKLNSANCSNLILDENYIYYIDSNDNRSLYRMKKDGTEKKKIVESYIYDAVHFDGKIYAVSKEDIFSVNTDGSDFMIMGREYAEDINVLAKNIYFINRKNQHIYKMNLDGSNLELVTDDGADYLNVCDGYIYYQNLSDGGCLYSISLVTGEKEKLNEEDSRYINVANGKIYFRVGKDTKKFYSIEQRKV